MAAIEWLPGHGDHEEGDEPPPPYVHGAGQPVTAIRASTIEPEAVEWLWRDRIPVGVVTALAGDGGLGKSTLTMHIASQVSRGTIVGKTGTRRVGVLLCEDSPSAVIVPRLAAAGADLDNIEILSVDYDGVEGPLSLPGDMKTLRSWVTEFKPELLIADPVMGLLGDGVDAHRDGGKGGIRAVLGPLHRIAEDVGTTVIACFHLNKGSGPSTQRIGGAAAIRNAVRNVLFLVPASSDGDDGHRLIGHDKSNYGETQPTLEARVESAPILTGDGVPLLRRDGTPATTARMVIGDESTTDFRDAMAAASAGDRNGHGGEPDALAQAMDFVTTELEDGPMPSKRLDAAASDAGIAKRTVERARKALGVRSSKTATGWVVSLPQKPGGLDGLDGHAVTAGDSTAGPHANTANTAKDANLGGKNPLAFLDPADDWEAAL